MPDTLRGLRVLNDPLLNKGTAFSFEERSALGLHGLLPAQVETLDQQVTRAYHAYLRKEDDLERHINLRALQDTNEVLLYRLLLDHIDEMLPIVYTPVVAQACEQFSHIYRRPRGLFISYPLRDSVPLLLRNRPRREADVIVVTDGERILGTGDQGAGGMAIPIGKLSLYTLIGGIHPSRTLPILLDVGTNNEQRLRDPEYLGWRHPRIGGDDYFDFVDRFVQAVRQEFPHACLQWEDFSQAHARPILERYRDRLLTFNDDIQGTAAVALAAVLAAVQVAGRVLRDECIVLLGAGSASIGVADYLRAALVADGMDAAAATRRFWMVDVNGLLHSARTDLNPEQRVYAQPAEALHDWTRRPDGSIGLDEVVRRVPATVLIGLSTARGAFTEPVVRAMASHTARPAILPLSNPTECSEATPQQIVDWTAGRAIIATGSPFPPAVADGRSIPIAQCNNSYIFPAVGLALAIGGARRVTDEMLIAAARELASHSPALRDPAAPLLPKFEHLRELAVKIAVAVALQARRQDLSPAASPLAPEQLLERARSRQWIPRYEPLLP
jgi:malate dehydrogenase (oxaloacetate-decarboxylating)